MLKVQCQCGHRMAVPDDFAGKRVKCAKCKGAIAVPTSGGAGASAPAPRSASRAPASAPAAASAAAADLRIQRSRRHAMERKRKSHNITVAIVAGAMVVLGLGLLFFIGSMNRSVDPPAAPVNVASSQGGGDAAKSSSLSRIEKWTPASTDGSGEMADKESGTSSSETKEPDFTAGSPSPAIAGTTATFDADGGVTTLVTQSLPLTVAEKTLQLSMTVTHDGRDIRTATQLGALIRLTGDFTGLISGANSDEPRLTIEADGRDVSFQPPTSQGESDDRKGENGVEKIPKWVEYSLGKAEIEAIAKAKSIRATLGGSTFDFSAEQLALFRAMVPSVTPPVKDPDKTVSSDDAEPGSSESKAAPTDEVDNDARVEKEMMDEKMKKK